MNILIVDDQINVLSGILKAIHFEELGFDSVETAMSAAEALEILEKKPIHIMMTDIEMPGPNGLELNSIVREKYPDILRIVLTSHAEFSYAQASVKLGCFDYIVQPTPFEDIEAALKKAINAVKVNYNNRRLNQYGSLFQVNKTDFVGTIVQKLYSNGPEDMERSIELLNEAGYPVHQDSMAQLLVVDVFAYTHSTPGYPAQRAIMAAISSALKAVPPFANFNLLVSLNPYRQFTILLLEKEDSHFPAEEKAISDFYDSLCQRFPDFPIACYIGDLFQFSNIQLAVTAANHYIRNNVADEPTLAHIDQGLLLQEDNPASLPDYQNYWSKLLYSGQRGLLKKDIDFCLDTKLAVMPNRFQALCDLHRQIIQLFFKYYYDKGIDVSSLFNESFTYQDCMSSFGTVEEVKHTVDFLLDATFSTQPQAAPDYIEKAKEYISENYNRLLSVKEVADYVHLNPEYFTRLFKTETGQNLKNYIIDCKLMMAKDLLANSNLPVSMVALEVGYSSFSHFTQIFKKAENMTPSEYKLRVTKQNSTGSPE